MNYTKDQLIAFELGHCQRNWATACGGADNVPDEIWNTLESLKLDLLSDQPHAFSYGQAELLLSASKY